MGNTLADLTYRFLFPDATQVDPEGTGLVAIGGDLDVDTLRCAYQQGLFPWFNPGEPIMWWSPEPRCVIYPETFKPSKSLTRRIKRSDWWLTINTAFGAVIHACSEARAYSDGTWIHASMIDAYQNLHAHGDAYSIEIWQHKPDLSTNHLTDQNLIGGLYGLKFGQAFFGESMFHRATDASKAAFFVLMRLAKLSGFAWVDCQLPNDHLLSLGASILPRDEFLPKLAKQVTQQNVNWSAISGKPYRLADLLDDDIWQYRNHAIIDIQS